MPIASRLLFGFLFLVSSAEAFEPGERVAVVREVDARSDRVKPFALSPGAIVTVEAVEADRVRVVSGRIGWVESSALIAADKAEAYFTDLLAKNPEDTAAKIARGRYRFSTGDHVRAIADLNEALAQKPDSGALAIRAFSKKRSGDKDGALADFDAAIEADPKNALAWRVRGATYASKADYAKTRDNYNESVRLDPENPESLHHRVIFLSACQDDRMRDGKQAIADATKACEVSEWKNTLFINGLAMAYAEAGDFENALKWQNKVIEMTGQGKTQLELYKQHKPFRMTWR